MHFTFPNIRHLRIFQEVARQGGISAASNVVHLSQPAITQAISKLEKMLDVKLFIRLSDGMRTTESGEIFLRRVERMFNQIATGVNEAKECLTKRDKYSFENFDRMVTATQLRALMALADAKNFTIAARNVGISQPTIHRAGRDLEQLAGVDLFNSASHGIELTNAAKLLARCVGLAATELQQGFDEIAAFKGHEATKITIGSMPLAQTWILPQVIHTMLQENSGLQILTIEGPYPELLQGLRHGKIDFLVGALRDPEPAVDVVQEAIFNDPLTLVVRNGHPLVGRKLNSISDMFGFPWIAPPISTPTGSYLNELLNIPNMEQTPVRAVSSSMMLIRELLLAGDYVTIASLHQIHHELEQNTLVVLPLKLPNSARPIGLTYRVDWQATKIQSLVLNKIRNAEDKNLI